MLGLFKCTKNRKIDVMDLVPSDLKEAHELVKKEKTF